MELFFIKSLYSCQQREWSLGMNPVSIYLLIKVLMPDTVVGHLFNLINGMKIILTSSGLSNTFCECFPVVALFKDPKSMSRKVNDDDPELELLYLVSTANKNSQGITNDVFFLRKENIPQAGGFSITMLLVLLVSLTLVFLVDPTHMNVSCMIFSVLTILLFVRGEGITIFLIRHNTAALL